MNPKLPLYRKTLGEKTYILLMSYSQNSGNLTFFWRLGVRGQTDSYITPTLEGNMEVKRVSFSADFPEAIKTWATKMIMKPEFR